MNEVYLASPRTQQQAEHAAGMPVLFSFACYSPWLDRYQQTFRRLLIDSGAYSAHTTGKKVDVVQYGEWSLRWAETADAIAGLDDISGDWRQSLKNYELVPHGFPTIHNTDPPELLRDLIGMAQSRGGWLGVGIAPPREGKEAFVRWVCDSVPDDIHLHGWALRRYWNIRRLDSVDSTNWWRESMTIANQLPWLTYGESLEIMVKRYQREARDMRGAKSSENRTLFDEVG